MFLFVARQTLEQSLTRLPDNQTLSLITTDNSLLLTLKNKIKRRRNCMG
jgi:hypothetical protein